MTQDPRHPKSEYEPKYPYNRVRVTESGHEVHMDDTPGKERIRLAHKDGSYVEISPGGRRVDMTTGNHVQYVKGGQTTTVDKNADLKYGGSVRTNVSGDSHSEIKGTVSAAVEGDSIQAVGGDSVSAVGGDSVSAVTGKSVSKVGGGYEVKGDSTATIRINAEVDLQSGSSITATVGGATVFIDSGTVKIDVGGFSATFTAGGLAMEGGMITHNGHNIGETHVHINVEPGGGLSGPPL